MEHPQSICTLKVNINCCTMCQLKAKEKLQKINGVESVVYDSKGVVTISGKVNPMTIIKKLEKWGKKAELLSFQKSSKQEVQATGIDDHGSHCCHCDAISDSDSDDNHDHHDHGHDCEASGSKKSNPNITWQHPDLIMNNKQSTKSKGKKGFLGLFCKKVGGAKKKQLDHGVTMLGKPSMVDHHGPSKWQFPRTPPMAEYGGPRPYYRPFEPFHPPVMGRPPSAPPPYYPFGLMRPPPPPLVPPPYGFFNSRPPPKVNPMIHYTSYADNYSRW